MRVKVFRGGTMGQKREVVIVGSDAGGTMTDMV